MNKKILVSVLSVALVLCTAAGVTLAWLKDTTEPVVNTFTVGDINIDLDETQREYKMVPDALIDKDPTVTVKAGSEACWLFVKIEESADFDEYMTYETDSVWTALAGYTGVYYYNGTDLNNLLTVDKTYSVLKDDQVKVLGTVTKEDLNSFDTNGDGALSDAEKANLPTLTFTAYAVQKLSFDSAASAWAEASK